MRVIFFNMVDLSLTACGRQGLIHDWILNDTRHTGFFRNADFQVAGDVVKLGFWDWCYEGLHCTYGGLYRVV